MNIQAIIKDSADIVKTYSPAGTRVVLFGSWARGNALATSDVDIGIMGDKPLPFSTYVKIKEQIDAIPTLRKIDVVDLQATEERFRTMALQTATDL